MSHIIYIIVIFSTTGVCYFLFTRFFKRPKKIREISTPLADKYLSEGFVFVTTKDIDPGTRIRIPSLSKEEEEIENALRVENRHLTIADFFSR